MEEQLRKLNLKFEIIRAVDGRNIPDCDLKCYSRQDAVKCAGRELSPGEIGCALSHAKMWERLVEENLNEVLILEDDVVVGETFTRILDLRHKFPGDWELVNFMTSAKQIPFGAPIYDIYRVCRFKGHANGACAYLLGRAGAGKLLSHVYPIRWAADGMTGRTYITGLVSYGIDPKVMALGNFESDIWKGQDGF
jgi:glycosyl transferase family 25